MNTLKHGDSKGKHKDGEKRGERERAIDFPPPPKPQFIILRDPLYRLAAFRLFVILVTQKRSQRRILFCATCSRDEGWRHERRCPGNLILSAASVYTAK